MDGYALFAHECAARLLPQLGLHIPAGERVRLEAMGRAVADEQSPITPLLCPMMQQLLNEIRRLETRGWHN